jgi:hypothetical protein
MDNRFAIRRGRVKFDYSNNFTQYVLQINVSESSVAIKDAYASFTDRWLKMFTLTGGAFNRPFGYEVSYSSSALETPERARIEQALFPNEEDLGAQLTIQAPSTSPWKFIKFQGGMFTGNGLNPETDKYKDFIGQVILKQTFLDENLMLSGGASYYNGGFAAVTPAGNINEIVSGKTNWAYVYDWKNSNTGFNKDSVKGGAKLKREYVGFDLQASLHSSIGITTLRGEYIFGTQPGIAGLNGNASPTAAYTVTAATTTPVYTGIRDTSNKVIKVQSGSTTKPATMDYYSRSFNGGYITLIQSIMNTKHELVVKYDWYDPNSMVAGNKIGLLAKTGAGDLKFSTIGVGWNYYWTSNLKLTAFYEMVTNETSTKLTGTNGTNNYSKDLKDNVLTLRMQAKF